MGTYTPITDFSVKDALSTGNPSKLILGSEVDAEFSAIQTAVNSKLDDVNALSAETVVDYAADYLAMYDNSTTTTKKVLVDNIRKGVMERTRLSYFRASSGTTTSLPSGATTNIDLSLEGPDIGSNFASNQYTVPYTGFYLFTGNVYVTGTPGSASTLTCYIRIGAGYYYIGVCLMEPSISQTWSVNGSTILSMSAGQTVGLSVTHNAGATLTASAGGSNNLQGFFIREIS